jgi:hypothetical protein
MHKSKFFSLLNNKDLVVIFFHSYSKPTNFKAYRVPNITDFPFPATAGNLLFTTCLIVDFDQFLAQLPKELVIVAGWSGRDTSWIKLESFSFFAAYEKLRLFSLLFIFKFAT